LNTVGATHGGVTAIGFEAAKLITDSVISAVGPPGYYPPTAVGYKAGSVNTTNLTGCVLVGYLAGAVGTAIGGYCTFIGANTGSGSGSSNVGIGANCGQNMNGSDNIAIGLQASSFAALSGAGNICIGTNSGRITSGSNNCFIGKLSGNSSSYGGAVPTTGGNNVLIGAETSLLVNSNSSAIALGHQASAGANELCVGSANAQINTVLLGRGGASQTTANAVKIQTMRASGTNTSMTVGTLTLAGAQGTGTGAGGDVIISTAPAGSSGSSLNAHVERMRIDSNGNVLVNYTTLRTNFFNGGVAAGRISLEGTSLSTSYISSVRNSNDSFSSLLMLGKTRGTAVGSNTIVQTGDQAGWLSFQAADGTNLIETNAIASIVTGTPGAGSLTGDLIFRGNNAAANTSERMRMTGSGRLLIGTTTNFSSATLLQVSANTNTTQVLDGYSNNSSSPTILTRKARGTAASPTAAQNDDFLMFLGAYPYGATAFASGTRASIAFRAAEDITDSAQGTYITFNTTPTGSTTVAERMRIDSTGNVGIGTATPATKLEVGNPVGYTEQRLITLSRQESTRYNGYMEFGTPSGSNFILTLGTRNNNVDFPALKLYDGNVGVKASSFGTSAAAAFGIANGTEPSTSVADQIVMGSVDLTAGNTIPYVRSEGTGMTGAGITNTSVTHKIAIKVNGTVYYLLATTDGT